MLLSNGLHRPKIRLKKFGFSPKTVHANSAKKLPSQRCSKPFLIAIFNFSHKRPTFAFTPESGYTLAFWKKIAHKGTHGETGAIQMGALLLPSDCFTRFRNPAWPGVERQTVPLLSLGRGHSRRTQRACGTAMRLCASLSRRCRGPAGLRDPFSSVEIVACMPCAQGLSACARHGRYHYPRRALRAAETPDGRLQKRLTCRFLRSGEQRSLRSAYFFRIYRIFCRQFQLQTLLRYGTINPRN